MGVVAKEVVVITKKRRVIIEEIEGRTKEVRVIIETTSVLCPIGKGLNVSGIAEGRRLAFLKLINNILFTIYSSAT